MLFNIDNKIFGGLRDHSQMTSVRGGGGGHLTRIDKGAWGSSRGGGGGSLTKLISTMILQKAGEKKSQRKKKYY